jgi:acyl-CoA dehydrogenase
LKTFAHEQGLFAEAAFRRKLVEAEAALDALEATELRVVSSLSHGEPPSLGLAGQMKVQGTELRQRLTEIAVEAVGAYAAPSPTSRDGSNAGAVGFDYAPLAMGQYLNDRAASIYAGSNEVQRNIIAAVLLRP